MSVSKPFNDVLDKQKVVLKTQLFSKIFRFLYRSFVSLNHGLMAQSVRASEQNSVIWAQIQLMPTFSSHFKNPSVVNKIFEVVIESWPEWDLNLRPLSSVQTL